MSGCQALGDLCAGELGEADQVPLGFSHNDERCRFGKQMRKRLRGESVEGFACDGFPNALRRVGVEKDLHAQCAEANGIC
ncbi:hypothetical protein ALQ34_04459 [Pseudomonas syringae pv. maculicola]|nr:hypothetical protein ALQ34_04459 [Pseudomonas syringae pv. maculicola]